MSWGDDDHPDRPGPTGKTIPLRRLPSASRRDKPNPAKSSNPSRPRSWLGLDPLHAGEPATIEDIFTALYDARYTGPLLLDFRNGSPQCYTIGRPRRGKLVRFPASKKRS